MLLLKKKKTGGGFFEFIETVKISREVFKVEPVHPHFSMLRYLIFALLLLISTAIIALVATFTSTEKQRLRVASK